MSERLYHLRTARRGKYRKLKRVLVKMDSVEFQYEGGVFRIEGNIPEFVLDLLDDVPRVGLIGAESSWDRIINLFGRLPVDYVAKSPVLGEWIKTALKLRKDKNEDEED